MMYQSLRPPAVAKDLRMQAPGVSPLFKGSQSQLTGNFWYKLIHHSIKNGKGGGARTPSHGFGDHWFTINRLPYMEEEVGFEPTEPFSSPPFQDGAIGHSAILPLG